MGGHADRSERTSETASSYGIGQNSGECIFSVLLSPFAANRDDLRDTRRRLRWRSRPYRGRNENPTLPRCFVEGLELRQRRAAKSLQLCAKCWESRQGRVESFSLQRLAVGLVHANESADEIYVLLISKGALTRRPGQLARCFSMVWIISKIMLQLVSGDTFVPGINQHRVINA